MEDETNGGNEEEAEKTYDMKAEESDVVDMGDSECSCACGCALVTFCKAELVTLTLKGLTSGIP